MDSTSKQVPATEPLYPEVPAMEDITFKLEYEPHEDCITQVKLEMEEIATNNDNPFENLQIAVKHESFNETENEASDELTANMQHEISIINVKNETVESILPNNDGEINLGGNNVEIDIKVKEEVENVVSYDYPNFDDSMDSSEAAALSQVEACLCEDMQIKNEIKDNCKNFPIKEESGIPVTETHLISKKLINTTSTITSHIDGLIQSNTTNTLVMEIHPVSSNQAFNRYPEEILPTLDNNYKTDMDGQSFLLNSITGNVLSLEQEAYGLLKSKKKVAIDGYTIKCPKCVKWYRNKYLLKRHLRIHEGIERREMGVINGLITKKANQLVKQRIEEKKDNYKHVNVENGDGYKCTCSQIYQRRSRMETCLRSHTDYAVTCQFSCATCQRKFKTKEQLLFHRNKFHRKKFPCKFCPTDYQSQKELFKHLQVHQKVQLMEYKVIAEVAKGNQELKCLICSKSCKTLPDLKSHIMDDHTKPYKCPYCDHDLFTKIMDFVDHMKKGHPNVGSQSVLDVVEAFSKLVKAWKCEECGQQFHEADKLALHQVEEHVPEMKNEQHFQCEDCQRVFISNQGLNSHRRMHHRVEPTEPEEPKEIGVMCLSCRKMCQDMTALTSHMRLHSMERKFPCKYCDYRFATQQKRKTHSEIHTGDMKYVCFICEYQCSSINRLKAHKISIKHLNMKEYLLTGKPLIEEEDKSKKEKIKDTLRKKEWHAKKRKKDKKRTRESTEIACDICGEKFSGESMMQEHKQTHPFIEFPNDDKPSRIFFK